MNERIDSDFIKRCENFAFEKHRGQIDDDGKSYFFSHLLQVYRILELITNDPIVLGASWLHDTIEDTNTTYEELIVFFGIAVADLVMEVSHEGKKDKYGFYFPRLKSKNAILIKFADRLSNLSRMDSWSKDRQEQYLRKSKFWKSELKESLPIDKDA